MKLVYLVIRIKHGELVESTISSQTNGILVILYGRKPIQLKQFLRFGTEIQGRVSSTM